MNIAPRAIPMHLKKNIKLGKIYKFIFLIFLLLLFNDRLFATELNYAEVKILDKVSSKTSQLTLNIQEEKAFENLLIKILKCKNSEFDDDPEITAYMQVQDVTIKSNDKVFVFNGWTFSSSPSISLFDHPVYDIWLTKCY